MLGRCDGCDEMEKRPFFTSAAGLAASIGGSSPPALPRLHASVFLRSLRLGDAVHHPTLEKVAAEARTAWKELRKSNGGQVWMQHDKSHKAKSLAERGRTGDRIEGGALVVD